MNYLIRSEQEFNSFCKRFENIYQVKKGEDGVYAILCKYGDIEPYSYPIETTEKPTLCCFQEFLTARGVNNTKRKLPDYCKITQEGDIDLVFKFPVDKLAEIAKIVSAKIKRHTVLSPEQKTVFEKHQFRHKPSRLTEAPASPIEATA